MKKVYYSALLNKTMTCKEILDFNKSKSLTQNKKFLKIEEKYEVKPSASINKNKIFMSALTSVLADKIF